mgnify:CR=1 FL=1
MSIHSSLRGVSTLVGERSVFSRRERLEILAKAGKFKEGERSVLGLPKVRTRFKVAGAKKVEKKAEGADDKKGAAAAPAAKAAAPAAKAPAKK